MVAILRLDLAGASSTARLGLGRWSEFDGVSSISLSLRWTGARSVMVDRSSVCGLFTVSLSLSLSHTHMRLGLEMI